MYSLAVAETKMLQKIETDVAFSKFLRFVISKGLVKSKQFFLRKNKQSDTITYYVTRVSFRMILV